MSERVRAYDDLDASLVLWLWILFTGANKFVKTDGSINYCYKIMHEDCSMEGNKIRELENRKISK